MRVLCTVTNKYGNGYVRDAVCIVHINDSVYNISFSTDGQQFKMFELSERNEYKLLDLTIASEESLFQYSTIWEHKISMNQMQQIQTEMKNCIRKVMVTSTFTTGFEIDAY